MSKNGLRNRLQIEGLTFRELEVEGKHGFVLRVMNRDVKPPTVTTIVRQPGHDTVTTETVRFSDDIVYPVDGGEHRFAPAQLVTDESPYKIGALLQANANPIADVALQHLFACSEVIDK